MVICRQERFKPESNREHITFLEGKCDMNLLFLMDRVPAALMFSAACFNKNMRVVGY